MIKKGANNCSLFCEEAMKTITLIGSTGSIGTQALEVARRHNITVKALAARSNVSLLDEQVREFKPEYVCITDKDKYSDLKTRISDTSCKIIAGEDGLSEIAALDGVDVFFNSVVGIVGLLPTLTAIKRGTDIALANKETLVAGGKLVMDEAGKNNVKIFPVDSEHSAIFQCLQGNNRKQLRKILLTASGGPFFGKKKEDLENVTVEEALNHPNWSMGNKITVDSATLMNKGLEFIEAKWLFDLEPEQIEILVHRQSVLHSAVEYDDYSVIGQMGVPDMKIPIQYALLYPDRFPCPTRPLLLTDYGSLTFEKPDFDTFNCLAACIGAIKNGGAYPCLVNGANEAAVALFLEKKVPFLKIGEWAMEILSAFPALPADTYEQIIEADRLARDYIYSKIC